jgi:uracil-DNA glycosylase
VFFCDKEVKEENKNFFRVLLVNSYFNKKRLLNSVLTVEKDKAGSHSKWGWEEFTNAVISFISKENEHVVFVLWGDYARKKKSLIDFSKHAIIESAHPSPLSSYRGFFGSNPFSKINAQLHQWGKDIVKW